MVSRSTAGIEGQVGVILVRAELVSGRHGRPPPVRRRGTRLAGVHADRDADRGVADRGRLRVTFWVTRDSKESPEPASAV
jgi:hypothetical protein